MSKFLVDSHKLQGAKDGKAGKKPTPPLNKEGCEAYWEGWKHPKATLKALR